MGLQSCGGGRQSSGTPSESYSVVQDDKVESKARKRGKKCAGWLGF